MHEVLNFSRSNFSAVKSLLEIAWSRENFFIQLWQNDNLEFWTIRVIYDGEFQDLRIEREDWDRVQKITATAIRKVIGDFEGPLAGASLDEVVDFFATAIEGINRLEELKDEFES